MAHSVTSLPVSAKRLARSWGRENVGYLNNLINYPGLACRVDTLREGEAQTASITVTAGPASRLERPRRVEGQRFFLPWWTEQATGSHPEVSRLVGSFINLACIPTAEAPGSGERNGREIRLYTDMVFPEGELQVTIPGSESGRTPAETISLGDVIGLHILAPGGPYSVWAPTAPH